jgi:hypothetical protein
MDQRTHSWIAIRAVALLEEEKKNKNMVDLFAPHIGRASVGAWIPDDIDAKRGGAGSATDNHILKTGPYQGGQRARFICTKEELMEQLGMYRQTAQFLSNDDYLDDQWWAAPYKGDVAKPGQHLPNRAMAMSTMLKDLLLMGNQEIDRLIPGEVRFTKYMVPEVRTQEEAAAMYFFMLSHFIADSCMPCHCDGRKLAGYAEGLHKELETYWSEKVGTGFEKNNLLQKDSGQTTADVLQKSRDIDSEFGLNFTGIKIPDLRPDHDVWLEIIYVCRATFAVASIIAPYKQYKYDDPDARAPFDTIFGGANKQVLEGSSRAVMYDAVLNTAIVWKYIWNKVSKD